MRFAASLLAWALAAATAAAVADPPATPASAAAEAAPAATPTPAASPTTATSASPAIAHAAAAAAPAADPESEAAATERRLRTAGYKPQVISGVKVWCRTENSLGSRLAQQKNCGTAQDLERSVRETQNRIAGEQNRQWNPTHN